MNWPALLWATFVSFCISFFLVWLMRKAAPLLGLVDKPDARRKLHEQAIPVGGGIAIFLAAGLVLFGLSWISDPWLYLVREHIRAFLALGTGGLLLVIVGSLDDRFSISGITKLMVQVIASCVVVLGGMSIESISLFGHEISLGSYAFPFAVFWLIGAINAMNLLDGLDGMAGTIGFMIVITIGIGSQISHSPEVAVIAFVFGGCLLGFLYHNLPPARIFLGDSGSMLIGLVGGALAIMGSHKSTGAVLFTVPVALLTIPILDSFAALLRRKLTGRSMFATDRNHFHHRLMNKLGCNRKVLLLVSALCIATSAIAITSQLLHNDWISLAGVMGIVVFLIVTDTFGLQEIKLVIRSLPSRFFQRRVQESGEHAGKTYTLQGYRPWELVWKELQLTTMKIGAKGVRLDINMPMDHEEFIAIWKEPSCISKDQCHEFKIALERDAKYIGHLELLFPPGTFDTKRDMLMAVSEIGMLCEQHIASLFEENTTQDTEENLVEIQKPRKNESETLLFLHYDQVKTD